MSLAQNLINSYFFDGYLPIDSLWWCSRPSLIKHCRLFLVLNNRKGRLNKLAEILPHFISKSLGSCFTKLSQA